MQEILQETHPNITVEVMPFCTTDIKVQSNFGDSFNKILSEYQASKGMVCVNNKYEPVFRHLHDIGLYDKNKLSILYPILHAYYVEYKKPADNHVLAEFFDNESEILNGLANAFTANTDLIPPTLKLSLRYYDGRIGSHAACIVNGTGPIDRHYQVNTRRMIEMSPSDGNHSIFSTQINIKDFLMERMERVAITALLCMREQRILGATQKNDAVIPGLQIAISQPKR